MGGLLGSSSPYDSGGLKRSPIKPRIGSAVILGGTLGIVTGAIPLALVPVDVVALAACRAGCESVEGVPLYQFLIGF